MGIACKWSEVMEPEALQPDRRAGWLYVESEPDTGEGALKQRPLRHTGNTLAASTGASTKELMSRMGHTSPRAALIYQHATSERDQALAEALSRLAEPVDTKSARLRSVKPTQAGYSINVRSTLSAPRTRSRSKGKSPGQTSGDERTRTADPLRAKQVL